MQVRACRAARAADKTDYVALIDARALMQAAGKAAHMRVSRLEPSVVFEADIAAVTALIPDFLHDAAARCEYRRSRCRAEIDALVHFRVPEQGMHPHAVTGRDTAAVKRRAHQGTLGALAFFVEIIGRAVRKSDAVERFDFALDFQGGVNNDALSHGRAVFGRRLVVEDFELVARVNVALEVDVVRIGPDHGRHNAPWHALAGPGFIQRRFDFSSGGDALALDRRFFHVAGELAIGAAGYGDLSGDFGLEGYAR